MTTYVLLLNFSEQGICKVKETAKRAEAFRKMADKVHARVKEVYWTLGSYDGVLILEAPDEATATSLALSLGSLGLFELKLYALSQEKRLEGSSPKWPDIELK